jgi:hypothetical protein
MDHMAKQLRALAVALHETANVLVSASAALQIEREERAASAEAQGEMQTSHDSLCTVDLQRMQVFSPLEFETRSAVDTRTAAFHLNRKEQTLRAWACLQNGPISPIRINGRLAWPVTELRRVCNVTLRR